jgi:hypothetical protein
LQDYKKEIIEINRNTSSIPLGLKTTVTGSIVTLKFHGLENFSSDVSVYDAKTEVTQPLTAANNTVEFLNTEGNQEDRFYLLFSPKDRTGLDQRTNNEILAYAADGFIKINSSPIDPIRSVKIYNIQGQVLSDDNNLSVITYESRQTKGKGIYLIEIKTLLNSTTKKVCIY